MKKIINFSCLLIGLFIALNSCTKVDPLTIFSNSQKSNITLDKTDVAPKTTDSANAAITINWTAAFADNESANKKYTIQIDTVNGDFSKPLYKSFVNTANGGITGSEINKFLLNAGFDFYTKVNLKIRVIAAYTNNNNSSVSDVSTFSYTIFPVPRVALPTSRKLFIIGAATASGWNNPVPDSNTFTRIDSFTWEGTFPLNGGSEFLVLPVNGSWDNKYAISDNSIANIRSAGNFGYNYTTNFAGPARKGVYKITLDFLRGKFKTVLVRYLSAPARIPTSGKLFMVGSATPGGWNNPVPSFSQQFTSTSADNSTFSGVFYMNGGSEFLMLPINGDWGFKYAVKSKSVANLGDNGGEFGYNNDNNAYNDNIPGPTNSGTYKYNIDFTLGIFELVKLKTYKFLYVPGAYQTNAWTPSSAAKLASPNSDGNYEGYVYFPSAGEFKISSQPDWNGTNYGAGATSSLISTSGGNLSVSSAGLYLIKVNTTTLAYSATKINSVGLIGDFNGWGSDLAMTFDPAKYEYSATLTVTATQGFKFRANGGWDINFGFHKDPANFGKSLDYGGDNLNLPAGTYNVKLNLATPGYYYFSAQ
ncbi:MAG: SusF/SusE family outer membrane protein [Sediminibacterium sp.]|nr:SusF/SusE family outer membrane protein [Sediminibacterium sp.]